MVSDRWLYLRFGVIVYLDRNGIRGINLVSDLRLFGFRIIKIMDLRLYYFFSNCLGLEGDIKKII